MRNTGSGAQSIFYCGWQVEKS